MVEKGIIFVCWELSCSAGDRVQGGELESLSSSLASVVGESGQVKRRQGREM